MATTSKNGRLETRLRSFFGLSQLPFTKEVETHQLFDTDTLSRAHERLGYLVDRRGTGVIFGTPGSGKSTLIRNFVSSLPKTSHCVCYIDNTNCATVDLFREIARGFQIQPRFRKADIMRDIKERILKLSRVQKVRVVLVIDEAHRLPSANLDEIRLLTSFDQDSRDDLTLILAGHPQLESNLRLAVNEAMAQRIIVRVHLRPLRSEEVDTYLKFRLELAGRTAKLFLPDAVEAIFRASRGIPRTIDRLAEHSLLLALRARKQDINTEIVSEAIDEVDP